VTNYYVYYRVETGHIESLRLSVQKLFNSIQKQTGIAGRWMRRRDDATTYMEVYEEVKDEAAFEAVLARESASLGLERKIERFMSVDPACA